MSVRLSAFHLLLLAIGGIKQLVADDLLPNHLPNSDASSGDRVVVERQYLIELPVQYEYMPFNNGQINLHARIDESSYNSYYRASQGYSLSNSQQQPSSFSGYQYKVPQAQSPLAGLIRPSIITTTPTPQAGVPIAAAAPGQVEIDGNVIKSLVG